MNKIVNSYKTVILIFLLLSVSLIGCKKGGMESENLCQLDEIPPMDVMNLQAEEGDAQLNLSWTNPISSDFNKVAIHIDNKIYYSQSESYQIDNLTNGKLYTILIYSYDSCLNKSQGVQIKATPKAAIDTSKYLYPSDILPGITHWKITLPVDENGNDSRGLTYETRLTNPWEVIEDELIDFEYKPYFYATDSEVVFHAPCSGVTTSGSHYPRCELRQRVGGGNNYWSVNDYQYMHTVERIIHLPDNKRDVCFAQIHAPEDETLRLHYNYDKGLYLVWDESNKNYFQDEVSYSLGEPLDVQITVDNGTVNCRVENLKTKEIYEYSWKTTYSTGYFKAGCYTQSSIFLHEFYPEYQNENLDAYGEVRISKLELVENY